MTPMTHPAKTIPFIRRSARSGISTYGSMRLEKDCCLVGCTFLLEPIYSVSRNVPRPR